MTRERDVEARLVRGVRRAGGMAVKLAPVEKGCPDRLVILPRGRVWLVEVKAPAGRVSPAQELWHERAQQRGVHVVVVRGFEGVDAWLAEVTPGG